MKTLLCDRCGKVYEKNGEAKFKMTKLQPKASRYYKTFDLCPKCQEKLVQWVEEGKKDD